MKIFKSVNNFQGDDCSKTTNDFTCATEDSFLYMTTEPSSRSENTPRRSESTAAYQGYFSFICKRVFEFALCELRVYEKAMLIWVCDIFNVS